MLALRTAVLSRSHRCLSVVTFNIERVLSLGKRPDHHVPDLPVETCVCVPSFLAIASSPTRPFATLAHKSQSNTTIHHNKQDNDDNMEELCRKFLNVPSEEFVQGCAFLHKVALGNLEEIARLASDQPSLVNFRDYDRRTALHIAASEGHVDICRFLLEQESIQINRSDRWGGSPLDDAHRHRHTDVIAVLRQHGALFGSPSQANNFITAASEGDLDEVKALLDYGNVKNLINYSDYDQRTALHLAASEGRVEVVRFLCEQGANVNVRDRWGGTPLDDAQDQEECKEILQQYKAAHGPKHSAANTVKGKSLENEAALLDLMNQYGKVRNGVLSLDWHDVKDLLRGIGNDDDDEVIQKLFEVADEDGLGVISPQEFLAHSDTFLGGRPARIILVVGGPGSGKGVLSERLVQHCGVVHLSSGDLLRDEVRKGTRLGKQVEDIMKSGGLVSSAILVTLMKKHMKDHPGKRIILDGFPRSQQNAQDLVQLCGTPELALHLECDDATLLERILKRSRTTSTSSKRTDDNFHTALQRIRTYHKSQGMTLEFLREQHVPIVNLDCSTTPDGVWEQLRAIGRLMRAAVKLPVEKNGKGQNGNSSNDTVANLFP